MKNNPDQHNKYCATWRNKNKERYREYMNKYCAAWRDKNRERYRECSNKYNRDHYDPEKARLAYLKRKNKKSLILKE